MSRRQLGAVLAIAVLASCGGCSCAVDRFGGEETSSTVEESPPEARQPIAPEPTSPLDKPGQSPAENVEPSGNQQPPTGAQGGGEGQADAQPSPDQREPPGDPSSRASRGQAPPETGGQPAGTSDRSPGSANPAEAATARREASNSFERAKQAADRGDFNRACEIALDAWETAGAFPDDPACRKLAEEMEEKLRQWSPSANRQGTGAKNKPLVID